MHIRMSESVKKQRTTIQQKGQESESKDEKNASSTLKGVCDTTAPATGRMRCCWSQLIHEHTSFRDSNHIMSIIKQFWAKKHHRHRQSVMHEVISPIFGDSCFSIIPLHISQLSDHAGTSPHQSMTAPLYGLDRIISIFLSFGPWSESTTRLWKLQFFTWLWLNSSFDSSVLILYFTVLQFFCWQQPSPSGGSPSVIVKAS